MRWGREAERSTGEGRGKVGHWATLATPRHAAARTAARFLDGRFLFGWLSPWACKGEGRRDGGRARGPGGEAGSPNRRAYERVGSSGARKKWWLL